MWIIDAKYSHALLDPKQKHIFQFFPERLPIVTAKIERINILVLLRRIFGVLNRSVRSMAKPLRMFFDVGMIGRTLKGNVECDVDSSLGRGRDERSKIIERAK